MEQFAPQGANYRQSYSLLVNLPDLAPENKSVSSVRVYVLVYFVRWLCFVGFIWGKGRKFSKRGRKNGRFFREKGVAIGNFCNFAGSWSRTRNEKPVHYQDVRGGLRHVPSVITQISPSHRRGFLVAFCEKI